MADKRCIVSYDPAYGDMKQQLESRGIGVAYQNNGSGQMVASIPENQIESLKGLEGISEIREEPLKPLMPVK